MTLRWLGLLFVLVACGSTPPPKEPRAAPKKHKTTAQRKASESLYVNGIPTRCEKRGKECLPPRPWVTSLCDDLHPDVALHMFQPETPWQRFYMLARAVPFNASGGTSLLGDRLEPGEEVIALRRRAAEGQFQVGDQEGYDVLRWNGACATIHDGDFSREPPRQVRHSKVEWRRLGLDLRLALEEDPDIAEAYEDRRKSCKGVSLGRVSKDCEDNDSRLIEEVVRYVRTGRALPAPAKTPKIP